MQLAIIMSEQKAVSTIEHLVGHSDDDTMVREPIKRDPRSEAKDDVRFASARRKWLPNGKGEVSSQDVLETLRQAANTAADEARSAYLTFGAFALYFLITVGATSHEQLLRGSIITMPLLGVDIPIVGFYVVVPFLFVLAHLNLLLHLASLATALSNLRARSHDEWPSQEALLRPFSRFLLARFTEADLTRSLIRTVAFFSIVLMPLVVLLTAQIRFLPYHSVEVAWWQRSLIMADLLILWLFWPRIISGGSRLRQTKARAAEHATFVALIVPLTVLTSASTVPGEGLENLLTDRPALVRSASAEAQSADSQATKDGCSTLWQPWTYFAVIKSETTLGSVLCITHLLYEQSATPMGARRNLILTHADLVTARPLAELQTDLEALSTWLSDRKKRGEVLNHFWQDAGRGIDLRGRDLRFADLSGSDLRKADFRGAALRGAKFVNANINYAAFGDIQVGEISGCVTKHDENSGKCLTDLSAADLKGATAQFGSFWKALLPGAQLKGTNLSNTQLSHADLTGANLDGARLDSATLFKTILNDAKLTGTKLQGTNLKRAELNSAVITSDLNTAEIEDTQFNCAVMSSDAIRAALANRADLACVDDDRRSGG